MVKRSETATANREWGAQRMPNTMMVWVRFTAERIHSWPGANPLNEFTKHLAHPHRHLFHIEANFDVKHNDRQLTFEELRAEVEHAFELEVPYESYLSCEAMAEVVADNLVHKHALPLALLKVSEDGESGATWIAGND